jgi:aspartate/methionine/tyrosine aminotransferase
MHSLAEQLNERLRDTVVEDLLSDLGKRFYFPRGIVAQTSEAKRYATKYNATAGMAYDHGQPMHLSTIRRYLPDLQPEEIFAYSTTSGESVLRELWQQEMVRKNPSLEGTTTSLPLVVSGLTHGISLMADLFADSGDVVVLPELFWGNYRLIFEGRREARLVTFPFFDAQGGFNVRGLQGAIEDHGAGKVIVLLNFPNNPTGYSPSIKEAEQIVKLLDELASENLKLIVITDDAYFGLFYEKGVYTESLFGPLASQNENLLAIKVDGTTKEDLSWGFRIGFLTFGSKGLSADHYEALERKTMGLIRATTSNASRPAQSLLIKAIQSETYLAEKEKSLELMKKKYLKVKEILSRSSLPPPLSVFPFNSGYFMCFEMKEGGAESLRQKLLHDHGIGTISVDRHLLRVAFSYIDLEDMEEFYGTILRAAENLG